MAIPALDQHGLLPVGVHDCTWHEIEATFCWNAHRSTVFAGLRDFLEQRWLPLNLPVNFWANGSFTRRKDQPADIDIVADLSAFNDQTAFPAILLAMKNKELKDAYKVDFWVKHPLVPTDLTQFFQYAGLKAAAELGIDAKQIKGILRIAP
jgi:hypothetical protein